VELAGYRAMREPSFEQSSASASRTASAH